ncbi:hypothetical protein K440DRAFT_396630 [Wilcoxina mikolae CBS 423.85]|nr:hypothetical protein K440DRAFT_396630 [Wilcoxina mikolae CBS 423.85]
MHECLGGTKSHSTGLLCGGGGGDGGGGGLFSKYTTEGEKNLSAGPKSTLVCEYVLVLVLVSAHTPRPPDISVYLDSNSHDSSRARMLLFFVVVVVVFASISTAANCDINPLLIPLQLRNSTNGVLFRLKNQDFDLPVLIIQNVTVIDDTKLTNNTETENVSLPDLNIELEKYEFTAWGGTNVVGIGLGLESTFIKDLYQANHIPTRSYGLSYNKTWGSSTASLQVDSLVLGGYDKSRIDGESYESEITSNGHLDVEVDSIVVNLQDGTKESLFNGTTFNATLDNSFDQIVFPSGILDAYKSAVSAEVIPAAGVLDLVLDSKRYDTLLIHNKPFAGNMTIRLSNGFEATIPTELLSRAVNGRTVSSIFGPGMDPARGVFGAVFLSQLYLSVDYETRRRRRHQVRGQARTRSWAQYSAVF